MHQEEMNAALQQLDYMSLLEYRQTVGEIADPKRPNQSIARIGRLVGVMMKEPFASPKILPKLSKVTRAYRGWNLDERRLRTVTSQRTWQYRAMRHLAAEQLGPKATVVDFARDAKYERGFFRHLASSIHAYLCGDKKLRAKIDNALKAGARTGTALPKLSPESIVAAGGTALGTLLVQSVPVLGIVGAPVIAAIVLMLYAVGIDAFCNWVKSSPSTTQVEQ